MKTIELVSSNFVPHDVNESSLEASHTYWNTQISKAPALLELPTDFSRSAREDGEITEFFGSLPEDLSVRLRELSRGRNISLKALLLAAFAALLTRYSRQESALVLVQEGADEGEDESALFPVGVHADGDLEFAALACTTQTALEQGTVEGRLPFAAVVERVLTPSSPNAAVISPILFGFTETSADNRNDSARLAALSPEIGLFVGYYAPQMTLRLVYNNDLFTREWMGRLSERLTVLLYAVASEPDQPVARLPLLLPDERRQLLTEWNDTGADYPRLCVHRLFEEQAERSPDAVAIVFEEKQWTYAELNARANRLAHYLATLNVGPESLVGLFVERSLEMVVGILGVLKAGAAYLPLDPAYPVERLAFMLEDSQAALTLTQRSLLPNLSGNNGKFLCLDTDWAAVAGQSLVNPTVNATLDDLAYVIYTSGSTGRPKGVMVPHRGLTNYLWWAIRAYKTAEGNGSPLHSSIAFDLTVTALFPALLVGRSVHLLGQEAAVESLGRVLSEAHDFSLVKITPAHLELLSHQVPAAIAPRSARRFVVGGEALVGESLAFWRRHTPAIRIINEYGPTETTVGCCIYDVAAGDCPDGAIPIGRPIANTQLYVLDRYLAPVPVGASGELYIGGDGVARGYLNRPELTAEKFIPDPFREEGRLYRTGDLVRYLPNGNLEFLGRIDHQVKIRGFRIELGEIESALLRHPDVCEAVVIAREDTPGDKRLVAYVVSAEGGRSDTAQVRDFIAESLPDYMVPAHLVLLGNLPLTPNGKVDRKALPAPDAAAHRERPPTPPRTSLEIQLREIWQSALGIQPVGIDDNFFELGGHSVAAGRLFAAIAQTLGKSLPITSLIDAPTIRQQAEALQRTGGADDWKSLVAIKREGTRPPIFGIHAGQGTAFFYRHLALCLPAEQPFYGLQQQGLNGKPTAITSVKDMAAHYISEMREAQPQGPYHLVGYCFGGVVAFEMTRQLREQGEEVALSALINAISPTYDLSKGASSPQDMPRDMTVAHRGNPSAFRRTGVGLRGRIKDILRPPYRRFKRTITLAWRRHVPMSIVAGGWRLPWERGRSYTSCINDCAIERYVPAPCPGRILAIRGAGLFHDPTMGWAGHTSEPLDLLEVPGHYNLLFDIMNYPHVQRLADLLKKYLR